MNINLWLLILCWFVVGNCVGLPVEQREDDENQENKKMGVVGNPISNCIVTPWGCLDLSDPSIRPRLYGDVLGEESKTELDKIANKNRNIPLGSIQPNRGCIDHSDPSLCFKSMAD